MSFSDRTAAATPVWVALNFSGNAGSRENEGMAIECVCIVLPVSCSLSHLQNAKWTATKSNIVCLYYMDRH